MKTNCLTRKFLFHWAGCLLRVMRCRSLLWPAEVTFPESQQEFWAVLTVYPSGLPDRGGGYNKKFDTTKNTPCSALAASGENAGELPRVWHMPSHSSVGIPSRRAAAVIHRSVLTFSFTITFHHEYRVPGHLGWRASWLLQPVSPRLRQASRATETGAANNKAEPWWDLLCHYCVSVSELWLWGCRHRFFMPLWRRDVLREGVCGGEGLSRCVWFRRLVTRCCHPAKQMWPRNLLWLSRVWELRSYWLRSGLSYPSGLTFNCLLCRYADRWIDRTEYVNYFVFNFILSFLLILTCCTSVASVWNNRWRHHRTNLDLHGMRSAQVAGPFYRACFRPGAPGCVSVL